MAKKIEEFKELNEYEEVIGSFQYHGYRVISNFGVVNNDLEKLPRLSLLYKFNKGKNYFIFISVKRSFPSNEVSDISTQMLVIKKREDIKMVARNHFFDASDNTGNIVHVELDASENAINLLRNVMTVKK